MTVTRLLYAGAVALSLTLPAPSYAEESSTPFNTGDAGAILVRLETLKEQLEGSCHFVTFGSLDSNVDNVLLTGVATVNSSDTAVGTTAVSAGIDCLAVNRNGTVSLALALPGPNVVAATPGSVRKSPFTICARVTLHRLNNSVVTTSWHCGEPRPPIAR